MRNCLWKKGLVLGIIILFVGAGVLPSMGGTIVEKTTITVHKSGGYIQDLIDNANDGDTINIPSGTYYENIVIDKSINLIGEDKDTTIIDGGGKEDIVFINANWVNISGFTIQNSGSALCPYYDSGIHIIFGKNNIIKNNIILNNAVGIYLDDAADFNNIIGNSFFNDGLFVRYSCNHIVENNVVNGKPLVYLEDESDEVIDYEVGQVVLVNCKNITVENLNISNTDFGIELFETINSKIRNNTCMNNRFGIYLFHYCTDNIITGNTISNNYYGIHIYWQTKKNKIQNNNILNNDYGIMLSETKFEIIKGNIISNNDEGIILSKSKFILTLKNNLLSNKRDAYFSNTGRSLFWQNYWNKSRILPKLIHGEIVGGGGWFPSLPPYRIPSFKFDWFPAKEPYDI